MRETLAVKEWIVRFVREEIFGASDFPLPSATAALSLTTPSQAGSSLSYVATLHLSICRE